MNPTQSVIFTTLVSFLIYGFAGTEALTRTRNGIARVSGKTPTATPNHSPTPVFTPQVATGWAVLFLILIAMADVPATSDLAMGFGWLILLSIALAFGPDAFDNLTRLLGFNPSDSTLNPGGSGAGGTQPPKVL